jgi:cytoskeletal protein CcmA (bactofilin family)
MAKTNENEAPVINLIGNGTIIKGDIRANGDMRIDGTLTGSVRTKGKLVIGATGAIEGEIVCQSADFSGSIKANITVTDLMVLKATANVIGEIKVGKLAIEPGARFSGHCTMHEPAMKSTVTDDEKKHPQA